MVTKETALSVSTVCNEISTVKDSIELLTSDQELEEVSLWVNKKGTDEDGLTPSLTREIAIEALEKQLKVLESVYAALNEKAKEEANN
jgi:hypothetical protein